MAPVISTQSHVFCHLAAWLYTIMNDNRVQCVRARKYTPIKVMNRCKAAIWHDSYKVCNLSDKQSELLNFDTWSSAR